MDNKRLLIGITCFLGSLLLFWVGTMTPILGPLSEPTNLRAAWKEFALLQRAFVVGCFVASAYSVGMILDALVRFFKKN